METPAPPTTPPVPATPPTPPAPPSAPPKPPEPPKPAPSGESAAEKRIRELNESKKAAEDRAKEAEAKLADRERQDLSEVERLKAEKADAEAARDEATAKATRFERGAWARAAAAALNFRDTSDAEQMLDLDALDTETKVKNAVEKLKEAKPHLIGEGDPASGGQPGVPPPGFGNLGGAGQQGGGDAVPVGADGQPDVKLGLGRELLQGLTGRRS